MHALLTEVAEQRKHLFLWLPVFIGIGVALYFNLKFEPPVAIGLMAFITTLCILVWTFKTHIFVPVLFLFLVALGFNAAQLRTYMAHTYFVPKDDQIAEVLGTITEIEDLGKDSRITLNNLIIEDIPPDKTPRKIRLRLRNDEGISIGMRVKGLTKLHKPSGPVLPSGFDFRRHMYFKGIGAVGFIFNDVEVLNTPSKTQWNAQIETLRHTIAQKIEAHVPYPAAGIAIALMTGRRTAIDDESNEAMRGAGLAHMLAISGLHIGLFSGAVFFIVRLLMALIPGFALHHPIKKYAAVIAIVCAGFYALLAGMNIPTLRALLMVSMAFTAILLDRSPISLRLVAFAAIVVLLIFPESLMSASFHMSFAAVVSLVVFYDRIRPLWSTMHRKAGMARRAALYFLGVSMTTVVASFATAPFALYHFHQIAAYGVIANFIAVPILGFAIMPAIIMTLFLMPFGALAKAPLFIIEHGIHMVLDIAQWAITLPHAILRLPQMPVFIILMIIGGILFSYLWRGRMAYLGLGLTGLGIILIPFNLNRPDILISQDMDIVGIYQNDRLYLNNSRKNGFARDIWLETLGLPTEATTRWPKERDKNTPFIVCDSGACRIKIKGKNISYIKNNESIIDECIYADLVISPIPVHNNTCKAELIDRSDTKHRGSHSVNIEKDNIKIRSAKQYLGKRKWIF